MNSSSNHFDVIVVGIGGMGSAVAFHVARRGYRVLGLDRYDIPNQMGSSHGITRIIRLAYYEHPSYIPLLVRAYELWRELEQLAGEQLLYVTGSIDAGPAGSELFEASRRSCQTYGLPHQILTASELTQCFPGYGLPPQMMAVFQPEGGFLLSERCIVAHVIAAQAWGAEIHAREAVTSWECRGEGVLVRTERDTYVADKLVIAVGPWISKVIEGFGQIIKAERQVVGWFQPLKPELFSPARFPVFNMLLEEGRFYGYPVFSVPGVKLGKYHHFRETVDPDDMDRECHERDERLLRDVVTRYFPDAAGPTMALKSCLFTNTPDEHFVLDLHPEYPQVAIASPCSGHGFKFSSVVGEIMADLVERGTTNHAISMHRLGRFNVQPKCRGQEH